MIFILTMLSYALALFLIVEICKKQYKLSTFFFILVLVTMPVWTGGVEGWFRWAKYLSVFLPIVALGLSRIAGVEGKKDGFWKVFASDKMMHFFYAIIFLNILEATLKDISMGNYFNALAGAALCATLPVAKKYWRIVGEGDGELIAYTGLFWAFLYTTWNACFVYAESPVYFAGSLTILLIAFFYPIVKKNPELYIHARIYTLATHLLMRAVFDFFPKLMNASSWANESFLKYWGIVNFALGLLYVMYYFYQMSQKNLENKLIK